MSVPDPGEPDAAVFDSPRRKDTELLDLCAAFLAVRTSVTAVLGEDELALALQARDFLAGRIRLIPPVSPEGVRTKA